jgi:hypothetical protein
MRRRRKRERSNDDDDYGDGEGLHKEGEEVGKRKKNMVKEDEEMEIC